VANPNHHTGSASSTLASDQVATLVGGTDGTQARILLTDSTGALITGGSTASSQYFSTAAEDNAQVKATAGLLYGFTAASTTAQYIQIHDDADGPTNGDVPQITVPVAANTTVAVTFIPPLSLSNGIWIGNSSTILTWTDGGDDCLFSVQYN
jgi:hypothetical protein